jgi:hypothetical protein
MIKLGEWWEIKSIFYFERIIGWRRGLLTLMVRFNKLFLLSINKDVFVVEMRMLCWGCRWKGLAVAVVEETLCLGKGDCGGVFFFAC